MEADANDALLESASRVDSSTQATPRQQALSSEHVVPVVAEIVDSHVPTDATRRQVELRRLHPSTRWIPVVEAVIGAIAPGFFIGFFVGHWNVVLFVICFVALPVALFHTLRFLTVGYALTESSLLVESGTIVRRERRIPIGRIQDLEIRQGFMHRFLGLARVEMTTAGSDALEVSLNVIRKVEAESLKRTIAASHDILFEPSQRLESIPQDAGEDASCLVQLSDRELVVGGLTSNLVASVVALIGAFLYFNFFFGLGTAWMNDVDQKAGKHLPAKPLAEIADRLQPQLPEEGWWGAIVQFAFADTLTKSVLLALTGLIFSVGSYVIRYHGFRLTRRGYVLEKSHGLLTHLKSSFAQNRIQALKIEEGLLRRLFQLAAVRVDSAGDRNEVGEQKKRDVLVPVIKSDEARKLASQTIPGLMDQEPDFRMVSRRAILRGSKKGWLLVLLAMLQTATMFDWVCLIWIPAFPLVYLLNYKWYLNTGYFLDEDYLISRKGWLNRATLYLPIRNIQNVSLIRSFFDRRAGLATLSVDTAGQSNTGGGPVIRHLPFEDAERMHRYLARRAESMKPIF